MKKNKLAVIRDNKLRDCPFGLPISEACQCAGDATHRMAPLSAVKDEEQKERLKKANSLVYVHHKTGKKCPFADKILEKYKKVDCDFGDTGQGQPHVPYRGSPLYPQTFTGIGLDGLYGYPLGFYADNNESRNLFFGLFSFLGSDEAEKLIKLADRYDECGKKEKADKIDAIMKRLENVRDREEYKEAFAQLEECLDEYRQKYESERTDTGLLWELADRWFGPRQVNR
jgi:hypothetical protein